MVAVLTLVQEVEKDCFGQALIAWVPIQHVFCQPQDIAFAQALTIESKIKPTMMKIPIKTAGGTK